MNYSQRNKAILAELESAANDAEKRFVDDPKSSFDLPIDVRSYLDVINKHADSSATAAFNNLVTGLAIKAAYPGIDVRYHQFQIQSPRHFNHRGVSEHVVYPFLRNHDFDGARSGWQTRTLERPKPYMLDYDENISCVKEEFLQSYHAIEEGGIDAKIALRYILLGQVERRNAKKIDIIRPKIDDIYTIISFFEQHFGAEYTARGAARLPVLALHSLYRLIIPQLKRFNGLTLQNLELHSAADSQTGATGDIEISKSDGSIFEAIEVKHQVAITPDMILDVARKLISRQVDRYYILTTHSNCGQNSLISERIKEIRERTGCQVIANGVLPTLKYYLRLVDDPSGIFPYYAELLGAESAISHEHRVKWNKIVLP